MTAISSVILICDSSPAFSTYSMSHPAPTGKTKSIWERSDFRLQTSKCTRYIFPVASVYVLHKRIRDITFIQIRSKSNIAFSELET